MRFNIFYPLVFVLPIFTALPAAAEAPLAQITVTAEGQANAQPDMALLSLGVTSEAETAAEALAANSAQMTKVLAYLEAQGIEGRDIQTSGLALQPRYDQSSYSSSGPAVTGFIAMNSVTVRLRALETLGAVLDQVVSEGANTFNGVSFGVQEPEPLLDQARYAAVAEARRRAMLYADAVGVTLGAVVSITEQQGFSGPMPMERSFAAKADVPVAAGEVALSVQVTVVYSVAE